MLPFAATADLGARIRKLTFEVAGPKRKTPQLANPTSRGTESNQSPMLRFYSLQRLAVNMSNSRAVFLCPRVARSSQEAVPDQPPGGELSGLSVGPAFSPVFLEAPRGTESLQTLCGSEWDSNLYGAFPVKSCFWFVVGSLFGAGKPFFVPSLRSGSRSAQKGVKGPQR